MISDKYTGHKFTAQSSELAVKLEDARAQLRMDDLRHDDTYIIGLIKSQVALIERVYSVAFLTKTVEEYQSGFPVSSSLPMYLAIAPVSAITSIKYVDSTGNEQTWSNSEYESRITPTETYVIPKVNYCYPSDLMIRPDAIRIVYTAGFGSVPSSVPDDYRLGILDRIGRAYTNREDSPESAYSMSDVLLQPLKRWN